MCFTASGHEEYNFDWEPITKSCWYIVVGHTFDIYHSVIEWHIANIKKTE
jgi:hypothetical protein